MIKKNLEVFLLVLIFILGTLLRFYRLGEVPFGLYQDETAIGYNAYSLLKTGRDEHGKPWPVYFKSFGDYKLPAYIYLTSLAVKAFGLNAFAVRFPSAFFGSLTILVFYFLIKAFLGDRRLALLASFFLTLNPWHLHYSRATFEVSLSLFIFLLGVLLIKLALNREKNWLFVLGVSLFVFNIYTYNLTRLLSPLLLAFVCLFYQDKVRKLPKKTIFSSLAVAFLLSLPFLLTLFSFGGASSARGTFIFTSSAAQANLLEFRSYLAHLSLPFSSLFFNRYLLTLWQYILNLISYFSVPFFFTSGSAHGNHGIGNFGQFYPVELPLIILGLWTAITKKKDWLFFFLGWGFLVIAVASLTREAPHATRSFFLIPSLVLFSVYGFSEFFFFVRKKVFVWKAVGFLFCGLFIYCVIFYFTSYWVRFPILYAPSWRAADKELALFLKNEARDYDGILIDNSLGLVYSSLLFYQAYPPEKFQREAVWTPDDSEGFSKPEKFGKYEFREISWEEDLFLKKTLLVTKPERLPDGVSVLKTVFYPQRPVSFAVKQEIISYPVEEKAYVIVKSHEK